MFMFTFTKKDKYDTFYPFILSLLYFSIFHVQFLRQFNSNVRNIIKGIVNSYCALFHKYEEEFQMLNMLPGNFFMSLRWIQGIDGSQVVNLM